MLIFVQRTKKEFIEKEVSVIYWDRKKKFK